MPINLRPEGVSFKQVNRIIDRIDMDYGGTGWRNNPQFVAKYEKAIRSAQYRNKKAGSAMPLEQKAAGRDLGAPQSKIAKGEMDAGPRPTMGEELSKGDPKLAAEIDEGLQRTAERMRQERRVMPDRRLEDNTGAQNIGRENRVSDRRGAGVDRRQNIEEIKRLKGVRAAAMNPGPRDTHNYNIGKIDERIATARRSLIESAPGPTRQLGRIAGQTGKTLGLAGQAASIPEHWRALNAVHTEENKSAPWMDKFTAYAERVLGMPQGSSGRGLLPSEAKAARQL